MGYCIPPWIPIVVVSSTFMKNVSSCFNRVKTTQTLKIFLREESKSIFIYRSMIDIALDTLVQSELECPKNFSHSPPFEYDILIGFESLSRSSKKC